MTGPELASAIARDVLGWNEKAGFWWFVESCTGLRVAVEDSDLETLGFWRPDKSIFHIGMVTYWIERHSPAKCKIDFPSGKIRVEFNDGNLVAEAKDEWTAWTANRTIADCALAYWSAYRATVQAAEAGRSLAPS